MSAPLTRRQAAGLGGALAGAAVVGNGPVQAQQQQSRLKPPADDRLEILELIALYAWAYDCADAAMLKQTFTDDGELYVWGNIMARAGAGEGADGSFEAMIAHSLEMKDGRGWQHCADHHVFRDYDGASCMVYSYYTMFQADADGGNPQGRAMGHYTSHCLRTDAGWRFARRDVTRWDGTMPFTPGMGA